MALALRTERLTRPRQLILAHGVPELDLLLLVGTDRGENRGECVPRRRSESNVRVGDLLGGQADHVSQAMMRSARLAIGAPLAVRGAN